MRINKLTIPNSITETKGIKPINEQRLGSVVALVGKNGCGKTRILDLLQENLGKVITVNRFLDDSILYPPPIINSSLNKLKEFKEYLLVEEKKAILESVPDKSDEKIRNELIEVQKEFNYVKGKLKTVVHGTNVASSSIQAKIQIINNLLNEANANLERVYSNYFRRINYSELRALQSIIENTEEPVSSFEELIESITDNIDYNELTSVHKNSLKFLKKLPNQLVSDFLKSVPDTKKMESKISFKRFQSLKKSFESFLGKKLEWQTKILEETENDEGQVESKQIGIWLVDGREFNYLEFSEGEKSLFAYSLIFFLLEQNPNLRIKDSIVLIDEPELHLHADSEIDLISSLRLAIGEKGQLWIATHSLNILADLNYDEIFMVKNGKIHHPSSTIQRDSLSQLLSLDERVNKLSSFLISITDWTILNFITQCFSDPEVIEFSKSDDPQIVLFKKAIKNLSSEKDNLLLDFGAGKGRLFRQVINDTVFKSTISYSALEPITEHHSQLKNLGAKNIYQTHQEIPEKAFKFIVLCNVLHEIDLKDWVNALNNIIKGLTDDGFLIIIEAKILSKGEMIGEIGYLVLDIEELKVLFDLKEINYMTEKTNSNDIVCAMLPKSELKEIGKQNIEKTINALESNTFNKIQELRKEPVTEKNQSKLGRKAAFFSQLYINSKFAQKYLESL